MVVRSVNVTEPKEVLNIGFLSHFSFPKTLFPFFLHHHCLQFLYPTNFFVRECFSLLVCNRVLVQSLENVFLYLFPLFVLEVSLSSFALFLLTQRHFEEENNFASQKW